MEQIIIFFVGAFVSAVVALFIGKSRQNLMINLLKAKEEEQERERAQAIAVLEKTERNNKENRERLEFRNAELEKRMEMLSRENKSLSADKQSMQKELILLHEQMVRENEMSQRNFQEQLKLTQEQLQNATQELLNKRAEELSQKNTSQMGTIINPLKDTIKEMKAAMENSRDTHNKNTASLEKAIEEVMKRTAEIGQEADKLAHALRNENKTQGNWGELILDELLASQGLEEGIHYEKQVILRDNQGRAVLNEDSGKRMIPDTILHYPDGKDVVLDSKVSLTAFVDYQNAETDENRQLALERHVKSLRQHVVELARKDYSNYIKPPRQALNYVIMFVPNESALQLALYNDNTLWREAFEKGIFVTSEQNLIAALRMIQIAWTQVQQTRNQELIFEEARKLLDRVSDFLKLFDDMGQKLQTATDCYKKSAEKLRDGRQSVIGSSNKLIKLGAKLSPKKTLPEENEPLHSLD